MDVNGSDLNILVFHTDTLLFPILCECRVRRRELIAKIHLLPLKSLNLCKN